MVYSVEAAQDLVGKRIVVSLRHVRAGSADTFSGLWGTVESVQEDGVLLRVEGGVEDEHWMMPPDLDAIQPARAKFYQLGDDGEALEDVDFEAHWRVASDPSDLGCTE